MDRKIKKTSLMVNSLLKLKSKLPELVLQSVLLTLGVLIALAIGNWDEARKRDEEVNTMLTNLNREALNNSVAILSWTDYYSSLRLGIDSVLNNQKLEDLVFTQNGIDLSQLVNQSRPSVFLQQSTWQAAQASNIVQYFDYKIVYHLTNVYNYQTKIVQEEHDAIDALFLERVSFDPKEAKTTLFMVKALISSISENHKLMLVAYWQLLEEIDKHVNIEE